MSSSPTVEATARALRDAITAAGENDHTIAAATGVDLLELRHPELLTAATVAAVSRHLGLQAEEVIA